MIKCVTSPQMLGFEQSLDCILGSCSVKHLDVCLASVILVVWTALLNWSLKRYAVAFMFLVHCCLSLSSKERTEWNWVHLVGARPSACQEVSCNLPALSVPLRPPEACLWVVAWLLLHLLASVLRYVQSEVIIRVTVMTEEQEPSLRGWWG